MISGGKYMVVAKTKEGEITIRVNTKKRVEELRKQYKKIRVIKEREEM